MTISTTTAKNQYTASGAQTVFAYQFKVFAAAELEVYLGAMLQSSGFVVSNVGNDTGGNVTFAAAPPNGTVVTLKRRLPLVQALDLPTQGAFPSDAVEQQFDRLVMMLLDVDERLGRALLQSIVSTMTGVTLPAPVAGKALGWNGTADGLTNVEPSSGALLSVYMATVAAAADATAAQTLLGGTAVGRALFTAASDAAARATLGVQPVGEVIMWPLASPPAGFLECDGAQISRATYAALFAVLGTTYGPGDGTTTFNLPDYRGEFLRGWAHGSTNDPDKASRTNRGDGTTGDNVGTKQLSAFKNHGHFLHYNSPGGGTVGDFVNASVVHDNQQTASAAQFLDVTVASGGSVDETRPRNINTMFCIRY
jgi:microcystin-dependent protein